MVTPILISSTDEPRKLVVVTMEGPLADPAHVEAIRTVLPAVPDGHSLIVDLTETSEFSPGSIEALRSIATDATVLGQTMIVVCGNLDRRAELVLSDLDTLVPVVPALEDALPLAQSAA